MKKTRTDNVRGYDEIDALILNRWRETNDGSFIEQFTDDEIEGIAQYISKHKKADFRASDRADKEGVMHKDGWQPWEIVEAAHNSIIHEATARQAEAEETQADLMNVHFQVEVTKK